MVRQDFDKLSLTLLTMTTLAVTLSLSKGLCELGELCKKKMTHGFIYSKNVPACAEGRQVSCEYRL